MTAQDDSKRDDVTVLAEAIGDLPHVEWPGGYDEIGLAVLDAVYSVNANYESTTRKVIERYRERYPDAGSHTVADLRDAIEASGGPDRFAEDVVKNRQRTSTSNGILKAQAVADVCDALLDVGVKSAADLRAQMDGDAIVPVEKAWRGVKGQGSGITWRYLLMLIGVPGVKPDRMIIKFVSGRLGHGVTTDEAAILVASAAEQLGITATDADHRIWTATSQAKR